MVKLEVGELVVGKNVQGFEVAIVGITGDNAGLAVGEVAIDVKDGCTDGFQVADSEEGAATGLAEVGTTLGVTLVGLLVIGNVQIVKSSIAPAKR